MTLFFELIGGNLSPGMGAAKHSVSTFLEMTRNKVHRYVIFKIDEKSKEVVVEKTGSPSESFDDFTASFPENECRYGVFDFDYLSPENYQMSRVFFVSWCPNEALIRPKMIYATSKYRFKRALKGIHYEIQATDPSDLGFEVITDRVY